MGDFEASLVFNKQPFISIEEQWNGWMKSVPNLPLLCHQLSSFCNYLGLAANNTNNKKCLIKTCNITQTTANQISLIRRTNLNLRWMARHFVEIRIVLKPAIPGLICKGLINFGRDEEVLLGQKKHPKYPRMKTNDGLIKQENANESQKQHQIEWNERNVRGNFTYLKRLRVLFSMLFNYI